MLVPPPLRPGDRVGVFAGSSPFDATLALRGLGFLAERYRVVFDRGAFARAGYLAGDDARRRDELARLLADRSLAALVAVRGGYGLSRFAHGLDWGELARAPRWVVGFSDVTALHVEAWGAGVCSVHGPMVASLGRADRRARERFVDVLERPSATVRFEGLTTFAVGHGDGVAEGPLVGGNLTLLHASAAAGRLRLPEGCVLLLEDVTERPYRIDRMLTTLEVGGYFDRVAGFALGEMTDCGPGPDGVTVEAVLRERLGRRGVPVLAGLPVGHGSRNDPLVLGLPWRLDARRGVAAACGHEPRSGGA